MLRPQVRHDLMTRLDQCLRVDSGLAGSDWQEWLHVYLAGGSASEWAGSRPNEAAQDLDVIVAVNLAGAQGCNAFEGMNGGEAASALNAAFWRHFNADGWRPGFGGTWNLTAFCNQRAQGGIEAIKPYAAYDVTGMRWAVSPPHLPEHTIADFSPAVTQMARAVAAEARAILRMDEPLRTREARALWDRVHADRSAAFGDQGGGWQDAGNLVEKWLAYAPHGLLGKIRDLAMAKTAAYTPASASGYGASRPRGGFGKGREHWSQPPEQRTGRPGEHMYRFQSAEFHDQTMREGIAPRQSAGHLPDDPDQTVYMTSDDHVFHASPGAGHPGTPEWLRSHGDNEYHRHYKIDVSGLPLVEDRTYTNPETGQKRAWMATEHIGPERIRSHLPGSEHGVTYDMPDGSKQEWKPPVEPKTAAAQQNPPCRYCGEPIDDEDAEEGHDSHAECQQMAWCEAHQDYHDNPVEAEQHNDTHTEWSFHLPFRDGIHRGISKQFPAEVHQVIHDKSRPVAERAGFLRNHLNENPSDGMGLQRRLTNEERYGGTGHFGVHWTDSEPHARGWAEDDMYEGPVGSGPKPSVTHVVLHAASPDRDHIEEDPEELERRNMYGFDHQRSEREVPLKVGAPVHLTGISWKRGGEDEWNRHDFGKVAPKTAAWHHDTSGSDHSGVYLRFGDWPHDERSFSPASGYHEEGVSAYDLDRDGDPAIGHGLDRGHREHTDECDVDENGTCQFNDPWGEPDNDPQEEMRGRRTRAERSRYHGSDKPSEVGHLVRGEMSGVGYDGEPLLKNVKRVGDWIDHRHLFLDQAGPHRLARDPSDEDYEAPEEKPPYGYRNRTASLEPQGYWLDHRPPGPGHTSQSGRPQPSVPYHEATGRDPEDLVDVYRGAPEGTDRINQGDWVTLHGDWARDRGPNVLHARVPARHVYLDASERDDDEAGYHGPAITATASRDDEEDPDRYVTCEQGHSHWGALGAAGLLVRHREGDSGPYRYLLQKRSPHVHEGNTWSTPGGALQHGETPEEGAVREAEEEGLRLPAGTRHRHTSTDDHGGWKYSTVIMDAPHQFSPSGQENWESEGHGWFTPQQVRDLPLHPGFAASWDKVRKSAVAEKTAAPAHPWHNWAADQPHKAVIWHAQSRVRDDHPELTSPLPPPDAEGFSAEGHALLKKALTAGGYPPGRAERSFVLAHGAPDDNGTSQVAMIGSRMGIALHPRSWDPGTVAHEAAHLLDIRQHGRDPVQSARVPDEEMHGPEFAGHYATALDAISPGSGDDFLRHHADSMALVGNFRARVHGLPREYPGSEPMQREATTSGGVPQRPKRTPGSAMVYLDVPHGTVEPYEGQEGGHHVALAYLPRSIGDEDFERVKQRAREAATRHAPMKATAGGGEVFPPGTPSDRRRVAVVPVHAPGIHELHDEFSEFDRAHYDTYTPHVTRAQLGGHQVNPPPHPEASFPVTHVHVRRGDEVHSFPLTGPSQREAATGAAYYHGTRYNLNPGDVLEGGAKPANNPGAGRYEHVYMARTPSAAHAAGSLSYDEHGHRRNQPNVYEVEPLDAPERDPYTTGAVRSKRARVVRQVDPVNPPCSRCGKPLADDDMEYGASEHLGCEQQQKTAAAEHEVLYHSGGRDFPGDEEWVHLGTRTAAFNRAKDWNLERERRGEPAAPVYLHHVELGGSHYPNERSDNEANDPVWKDIATTHGHNVLPYINEYEDTGTTSYLAHHSAVKLLKTEPLTTEGIDEHWQRQQEYFGNPRHKTAVSGYDPPARSNWRVEMMHPRDLMQHIETYRTDDEGGRRHRQSLAESFRQHGYDPELHGGMSGNKHFSPVSSPITLVHDDEDSYFEEGNHRAHALNDAGWDEHVPVLVKDLRKQAVSGYDGLTGRSGMIYLDLPPGTVRQVPGGVDDHHITLCYLGKDVSDEAFEEACRRTKAAAARLAPMDGVLRGIDIFPPSKGSDGKVVAFVPAYVGSVGLLRRELEDLSASEHADWRPHVTLAYLEEGDSLPAPHPAVPLRFTRVHVKRGDDIRGYPLGGMQREASAEYTVPVHRGVWFGSHEEHPDLLSRLRANPEEALRAAAGGGKWGEGHLGSHWSSSADAARNFALGGFDEEGYPREHPVGVTFHGSVHPDHVMDPRSFEWKKMYLQHQILPSHSHEQEVTVRPGAPVRLHGITVHWGDVNGDEDGSQHHQVDRETPA
jgi:8-oxo-dGTP pyrophosphatase MutT (NUDIX family)/2'-5' RNA ligase